MLVEVTKAEFLKMYEKAEVHEVVEIEGKIYGRTSRHHGDYGVDSYVVWARMTP